MALTHEYHCGAPLAFLSVNCGAAKVIITVKQWATAPSLFFKGSLVGGVRNLLSCCIPLVKLNLQNRRGGSLFIQGADAFLREKSTSLFQGEEMPRIFIHRHAAWARIEGSDCRRRFSLRGIDASCGAKLRTDSRPSTMELLVDRRTHNANLCQHSKLLRNYIGVLFSNIFLLKS